MNKLLPSGLLLSASLLALVTSCAGDSAGVISFNTTTADVTAELGAAKCQIPSDGPLPPETPDYGPWKAALLLKNYTAGEIDCREVIGSTVKYLTLAPGALSDAFMAPVSCAVRKVVCVSATSSSGTIDVITSTRSVYVIRFRDDAAGKLTGEVSVYE